MLRFSGYCLVVCGFFLLACVENFAVAQTSAAEVLGVEAAREDLQGSAAGGNAEDAKDEVEKGEEKAASKKSGTSWPRQVLSNKDRQGANNDSNHAFDRGPGWYVSLLKIIPWLLMFWLWVKTTDWISQDTYRNRQNYGLWNLVVVCSFFLAILISWVVPIYAVGLVLMFIAWCAPLTCYIVIRNKAVESHKRVMTKQHLRYVMAVVVNKLGGKMEVEKLKDYEKGAKVEFIPQGGETERDDTANLIMARQSPGFVLVKNLISDAIDWRAEAVALESSTDSATIRYQIDGVWRETDVQEREAGDVIVAVIKTLAALDINERVKRQLGTFGIKYEGKKYKCRLQSQGTKTGERATVRFDVGKQAFQSLVQLGMRSKVAEGLQEVLDSDRGLVLFSSLPEGGLTTTIDVALAESDRLMRNFVSVEPESMRERDIENVEVTTFKAREGATPASVLPKLIRTYPEVIVVRNLTDTETGKILCDQVEENRLVITSLRAKEAPEALLRMLMLKIPRKTIAGAISVAVSQRLIRMLCSECKVGYEPSPDLLKKMGIPAGKLETLYREPTAEELDKPCPNCRGLGYYGRTSIFEVLTVEDKVRDMLLNEPNLAKAKKAARAAGMRTMQEEGILLVAKGTTSVNELMRVMKQ